jgi:hypothetical protein
VVRARVQYGTKGTVDGGFIEQKRLRMPRYREMAAAAERTDAAAAAKASADEAAAALNARVARACDEERAAQKAYKAKVAEDAELTRQAEERAGKVRAVAAAASLWHHFDVFFTGSR